MIVEYPICVLVYKNDMLKLVNKYYMNKTTYTYKQYQLLTIRFIEPKQDWKYSQCDLLNVKRVLLTISLVISWEGSDLLVMYKMVH